MSSQYYFSPNDSARSYQSTAGFNRAQQYSIPSPKPQVRASVRVLGSQDQYQLSNSPRIVQISPQQHHLLTFRYHIYIREVKRTFFGMKNLYLRSKKTFSRIRKVFFIRNLCLRSKKHFSTIKADFETKLSF